MTTRFPLIQQGAHRAELGQDRAACDFRRVTPSVLKIWARRKLSSALFKKMILAVQVVHALDFFQLVQDARQVRAGFGQQRRQRRGLLFRHRRDVGDLRDGGGAQALGEHSVQRARFRPATSNRVVRSACARSRRAASAARVRLSGERVIGRHNARLDRIGAQVKRQVLQDFHGVPVVLE